MIYIEIRRIDDPSVDATAVDATHLKLGWFYGKDQFVLKLINSASILVWQRSFELSVRNEDLCIHFARNGSSASSQN